MAFYELIFILRQDVSFSEVDDITNEFINLVQELGGSLVKKEYWELRTLAYKIKNNKKGHYVFLGIEINDEGLKEIARRMKYKEEIIRTSTIKVKQIDPNPSPILKVPCIQNDTVSVSNNVNKQQL